MNDLVVIIGGTAVGLGAAWLTGALSGPAARLGATSQAGLQWINAEGEAAWVPLAPKLQYRDFYSDTVECEDGWLWAGCEVAQIPVDGYSNANTNWLSAALNDAIVSLPDRVRLQTITRVEFDSGAGLAVYDRLVAEAADEVWKAVLRARRRLFERETERRRVRMVRQFVFVGLQVARKRQIKVKVKGLWSPAAWVDQSAAEHLEQRREVLAARETFRRFWKDCGGRSRDLLAREIFEMAWHRLNPTSSVQRAAGSGQLNLPSQAPAYTYRESPRELLAMISCEQTGAHLMWGDEWAVTLALHRLPEKLNCRSMEQLTRSTEIDFPYELSTHGLLLNAYDTDEKLEREEHYIAHGVSQARRINRSEIQKGAEIGQVREAVRAGQEKVVETGLGVTFFAPSRTELERRIYVMRGELRKIFGLEVIADRHAALVTHLSTLPCHTQRDVRRRKALSRDLMGLSGWTGGPTGVPHEEAQMVFQRADDGLFFFDPASPRFNAGLSIACGGTGSGKSALMTYLASAHLARGRRGVILDLDGSYHRLAVASVGPEAHIDVVDPQQVRGLKLFDVAARSSERFTTDELGEENAGPDAEQLRMGAPGVPRDRLAQIANLLEQLSLDPRTREGSLKPELRAHLHNIIARVYRHQTFRAPVMDDFIRAAELSRERGDEREWGAELAARWSVYASTGPLGGFFNSTASDGLRLTTTGEQKLVVFDFRGAGSDVRLMHIATLIVDAYLGRFVETPGPKFFFADELQQLTRWPLLTTAIDSCIRTARKKNALVAVGSQHPEDFEREQLKGIVVNCEVKYLFQMPVQAAARAFNLNAGETRLLNSLKHGGSEYRECALLSPLGAAHLRLRLNELDMRLCAPATSGDTEAVSVEEAESVIEGEVPERLATALRADRLGRHMRKEEVCVEV